MALLIPGILLGLGFIFALYLSASPLLHTWPHHPLPQSRAQPPSETVQAALLATRYALVSQGLSCSLKPAEQSMTVGMTFKNVGPTHLRWKVKSFIVEIEHQPQNTVLFLTREGTVGAEDSFGFETTNTMDPTGKSRAFLGSP